jgi:hypothetical protein
MRLTTLGVVAAAVLAATASATPGRRADGHGGYAGLLRIDTGLEVATWHDGQFVVHAAPGDDDPMTGPSAPWPRAPIRTPTTGPCCGGG